MLLEESETSKDIEDVIRVFPGPTRIRLVSILGREGVIQRGKARDLRQRRRMGFRNVAQRCGE